MVKGMNAVQTMQASPSVAITLLAWLVLLSTARRKGNITPMNLSNVNDITSQALKHNKKDRHITRSGNKIGNNYIQTGFLFMKVPQKNAK